MLCPRENGKQIEIVAKIEVEEVQESVICRYLQFIVEGFKLVLLLMVQQVVLLLLEAGHPNSVFIVIICDFSNFGAC